MEEKTHRQLFYISCLYMVIFVGSLLLPFVSIFGEVDDLLSGFKGKIRLINIYTNTRLKLGDQVYNRSVVGHDGWINLTDGYAMTDYQKISPLRRIELDNIYQSLDDFRSYIANHGGVFLFVVPPDKQTIYPEHVPPSILQNEGPSRLDQLMNYIDSADDSFPVLDLRSELLNGKNQYPVYYATDTHWNPIGALLAYDAIIYSLQSQFSGLSPHILSDFEIITNEPSLFNMSRVVGSDVLTERSVILKPKFQGQSVEFAFKIPSQNGSMQLYFSHTSDTNAPTALIFNDSFFDALRPFVSEHFSSAYYVNHVAASDGSYYAWYNQIRPDIVIFEVTERNIYSIPHLFNHEKQ